MCATPLASAPLAGASRRCSTCSPATLLMIRRTSTTSRNSRARSVSPATPTSRSSCELPVRQLELLQAVVATGTPVVLLVMNGRPLDLRWAIEHVPAILDIWYPGTQGGAAVANLLFGDISPGGKLPFSWPRTVGQVPMIYSHNRSHDPK